MPIHSAILSRFSLGIVLTACASLAGCNVDYLFPGKRAPQGPRGSVQSWPKAPRWGHSSNAVDITVVETDEASLVEAVVANRTAYHHKLQQLQDYYETHGDTAKEEWVRFELGGLRRVKAFKYLLEAEIASESLRPADSIAEADSMYEKGKKLMTTGGHGLPALYRQKTMVKAARVFRKLIEKYPSSDKIDDAAFFLGEIHKEYLPGQDTLAVKWYERAWTWDPETPHPARFQAAVVYDFRLHDRDRALELYRAVLDHETAIQSNVDWATRRIHALTKDFQTATVGNG